MPVPVTAPLPEIVDRLNALQPPALYGYPSVLARLAGEQAGRPAADPADDRSRAPARRCTPELRAAIRAGFGAPVVDTFGSTEGLVGAAPPDDDVIAFAEDGCIVELVDADDRPVPPGTPSAAVLVTYLSNRLQPLIRYGLTDSFVEQPPAAAHGYLRARVEGRSDEVLRFGAVTRAPAGHPVGARARTRGRGLPGPADTAGHRGRACSPRTGADRGRAAERPRPRARRGRARRPRGDRRRWWPTCRGTVSSGKLRRFVPAAPDRRPCRRSRESPGPLTTVVARPTTT